MPPALLTQGLTILNTATASYILAANFGTGNAIEVYDNTFTRTKLSGTFTDPGLPAGYAPFSVHVLNNQVYVAYALIKGSFSEETSSKTPRLTL